MLWPRIVLSLFEAVLRRRFMIGLIDICLGSNLTWL